jgi:hypothetical protein
MFNERKFLENVRTIHLNPAEFSVYDAISDAEVRGKLDAFIDYENNPRFSRALDEICANLVGRTMFKLLTTKMITRTVPKKMKLTEHSAGGSYYENSVVYINLSLYEERKGETGVTTRQYYFADEKGEIKTKLKSLVGSIFHEFCHALHYISGTARKNTLCLKGTYLYDTWDTDEELRTITCFNHDPICDHCFDFYQSILKGIPFYPRYGHKGYRSANLSQDASKRKKLAQSLPSSQKFMDGWGEYMI